MHTQHTAPTLEDEDTTTPVVELTPETFHLARHNGRVTIENPDTGQYRTFRIETCLGGPLQGKRIVGLLTGSDNVEGYLNFGFVTPEGAIQVWKRHRGTLLERYAKLLDPRQDLRRQARAALCRGRSL